MSSISVVQKMSTKYSGFSCLSYDDSDNDVEDNKINNSKESERKEILNIKNNILVTDAASPPPDINSTDWVSIKNNKKVTVPKKYNKKNFKSRSFDDEELHEKISKKHEDNFKVKESIPTKDNEENEEKHSNDVDVDVNVDVNKEVTEYKFQNKWYIWIHEVDSKDWSTKSYRIIHTIENISDFWQFFNNVHKLNQWKFNFFIMKGSSHPTWEHSTNRNGGTCSIRIDISQSVDIIEQLAILLVNESLTEEINDINGVSFAAKGNWCVIKIWNRDNKNNISNQMPSYLRKIYPAISIKYKENIPEY